MKIKISLIAAIAIGSSSLFAQTFELSKGWNLIGVQEKPYNNTAWSIDNFLNNNPNIEQITNITRTYTNGATRNSLKEIEPGKGYWVKVNKDVNLTINGIRSNDIFNKLSPGWSLIAIPYAINGLDSIKSFVNSFKDNGLKVEIITNITRTFDSNSKRNSLSSLDPNSGYWVKVLKQVDSKPIGSTGKKVIVYTDKDLSSSNSKNVTITVAGTDVNVTIPKDAEKAEVRIVDEFGKEIAGGIVLSADDIQKGSFTVDSSKVGDLNGITSVAYYVMSANPSGVPQPLSDVTVIDQDGNLIGTTDVNGIISVSGLEENTTLTFQKDGYSINSAKFNLDNAVQYIILTTSSTVDADELSENESNSNGKILNKKLDRYYTIKSVSGKKIGLIKMDGFSANPNLSNVKFDFSAIDTSSFYGKDELKKMVATYEDNGIKYVPKIITGVQGLVRIGGRVAKGGDASFKHIDRSGSATLEYYIPNFFVDTSYIRTQQQMAGALVKFYAFDGESWRELDDNDFKLLDANETAGHVPKFLKKLGYGEDSLVARVTDTTGIETVVGVLWNKESTLKEFKNIKVKVSETDGTAIKNALVKVLDQQTLTDENGIAQFSSISVPNDLANLTFEVNAPKHYRNIDRVRLDDLKDNKEIDISLQRPPSTGTINVAAIDQDSNPVAKATVDIITPAVLGDVNYKDGIISVAKESTADYIWYIKPNISQNSSSRTFKLLSSKRRLNKLDTTKWTEVAKGKGKNSITVGDLLKTVLSYGDPAVGSVKLGVYVKHKNGLEDGKKDNPAIIGQADILFNKDVLAKLGLEKPSDKDGPVCMKEEWEGNSNIDDVGIAGKATATNPYIAVTIPSSAQDLNITWNVMLIYENSDNQYYWDGKSWVKSEKLVDAGFLNNYAEDMYDIAKELNFTIQTSEKYLSFNRLAAFLSSEKIIKGLFIKKSDVDSNSTTQNIVDINKNEDSVLAGNIRLAVIPDVNFTIDSKESKFIAIAEAQQEGLKVSELLSMKDVALKPASILPHNIYSKTSEDGLLRVANVPFGFGKIKDTDKSYLDILASKAGYLDSKRETIPAFEEDNPSTPELEDVANVSLELDKREKGGLEITVLDKDNKIVSGAKIIIPNAIVQDDKLASSVTKDNDANDLNSSDGGIRVSGIFTGGYNVSVLKDGYKPANVSVVVTKDNIAKATVHLEKMQTGIVLTKPYVNNLDFTQSNEFLTVSGQIVDTEDNNYSNAAQATLALNDKTISIDVDSDGKFSKTVKLDKGVNSAALYVSNAEGTFKTSTKTFIYIGETAYFHGYVLDNDNTPLSNAIVEIDTDDGDTIYRTTNSDGLYEVNDMPVGSGAINAVWIDGDGYIYTAKDKYKIDSANSDIEKNLTIAYNKVSVDKPANVYVDTYNGASEIPSKVTTDSLELTGRVTDFDKENGKLSFDVTYDDGTTKSIVVDSDKLKSTNQDANSYSYSVSIPLKTGYNYINVKAENPVYGGIEFNLVVNKAKTEGNAPSTKAVDVLLNSPSGMPVYATVAISTLDGTPVGVYSAEDYNETVSYIEPKLTPNKYYIFDITASDYKELKQVKYISQDTDFIDFTLTPVESVSNQPEQNNSVPVVDITYTNSGVYYEFTANAYDADNDPLTYSWKIDGKNIDSCDNLSFCDTELEVGQHNIAVYVSDGVNEVNATKEVDVHNGAPTLELNDTLVNVTEGNVATVTATTSDPDGDYVTLSAESNDTNIATVSVNGNMIDITGMAKGNTTITVTASDGNGGSVSKEINVNVQQNSEGNSSLEYPPQVPSDLDNGADENSTLNPPPQVPSL